MDYQSTISKDNVPQQSVIARTRVWPLTAGLLLGFVLLGLGLWNLSEPPLWWDEGWTLSMARTWVEHGHYGRLLGGEPAPTGQAAAFSTTAWVALSFELFGVGIWQGRLVGVVFMLIALLASYMLAARLYNHRIAAGTLVVLLLLTMHPQLHPLTQGRQVLAEMPLYSYLLGGYLAFLAALRRWWWLPLACVLWGVALHTKAQITPFFYVALLTPLLVTLLTRQWKTAGMVAVALVGSWLAGRGYKELIAWVLAGQTISRPGLNGLRELVGFVLLPDNRWLALRVVIANALPLAAGMLYVLWRSSTQWWQTRYLEREDVVRLSLLALAGSWFAWYLFLSVGPPRYLAPAMFLGSMFIAVLFFDVTEGFRLDPLFQRIAGMLRHTRSPRALAAGTGSLLILLLVPSMLLSTLLMLNTYYLYNHDTSAVQVARFFNTQTEPDTIIETYESELHFLLNRPYHYPPDQVSIELNRRTLWQQDVPIAYDPLTADPDYLVIGDYARPGELYAPVIEAGEFRLLDTIGDYEVYERVREE